MSLVDELPNHRDDGFSRVKIAEHDEIQQQIAEFESRGGAIRQCDPGSSGISDSAIITRGHDGSMHCLNLKMVADKRKVKLCKAINTHPE